MRRNDILLLTGWFLAGLFGAAFLLNLWVGPVDGARRVQTSCWWEGTTLRAENLPSRPFGITADGFPHGVWLSSPDGSFTLDLAPIEVVFYTRGGGGALFKFGAQFQDYHPICVATP